jgi:phage gp16-like protein
MTSSIAAIHVAKKSLALDDDTYRAKLQIITGKTSTKEMTEAERQKVLTILRNDGFQPSPVKPAKGLTGKYAKKLQALWIAGYNLGLVRDRRDTALLAFVKRQTGVDHTQFLHQPEDGRAAIEAMKAWLRRDAGVTLGNTSGWDWLQNDGAKIAWVQWKLLNPNVSLMVRKGFDEEVSRILGIEHGLISAVTGRQWQSVMNALGEKIRTQRVCS